jgi:hypothetical protein
LQPQILVDFPEEEEERAILKENLPFADDAVLDYVVRFLQAAHRVDESYSARDGINIARFALKLLSTGDADPAIALRTSIIQTLGSEALRYVPA